MGLPIDRIFATISDYTRTMGELHHEFLEFSRRDIERYEELTQTLCDVMKQQATVVAAAATLSAACTCLGAFSSSSTPAQTTTPPSDPRLGANAGIGNTLSNGFKWVAEKLQDKSVSEAGTKLFDGISRAADPWYKGRTAGLDSKRELMKILFQEEQGDKGSCAREISRAQELALGVLQSKARGG